MVLGRSSAINNREYRIRRGLRDNSTDQGGYRGDTNENGKVLDEDFNKCNTQSRRRQC